MKPVHLISEPQSRRASITTFGGAAATAQWSTRLIATLLAVAIAATCTAGWLAWDINQRTNRARSTVQAVHAGQSNGVSAPVAGSPRPSPGTSQREDWERLARLLDTPWPALLDVLEMSLNESVAIVDVAPDPQRLSMLVQGEARTLESLLTYADRLKATGAFEDVTLIRHETNEQDPAHPIRLRINLLLKRTRPGASASSAEK